MDGGPAVARPGKLVFVDGMWASGWWWTCRPDLNLIEMGFSKLKARLRAAAKRTVRAVEGDLGELSTTFAPDECRNSFRSCGHSTATPARDPL